MRRHTFNLIEVVLALVVIAVGMLAITGLIPIGTRATRDAVGQNYAADAADSILHDLQLAVKNGQISLTDTTLPTEDALPQVGVAPDGADSATSWSTAWTAIPGDPLGPDVRWTNYYADPYYPANSNIRVFRITREGTTVGGATTYFFDAIVRIWKSPTEASFFAAGTPQTVSSPSVLLNVEVSWPAGVPFDQRHVAHYSLEVYP